ncbi:MAG TPA: hypothetical protein VEC35_01025 [Noviherbaspirillum sp.]|nr:hypothetical protein [Noviherbaspirillum sp.]
MSTKATIAHGERFHFYKDGMPDMRGLVCLEISGAEIEFDSQSKTVTIFLPEQQAGEMFAAIARATAQGAGDL